MTSDASGNPIELGLNSPTVEQGEIEVTRTYLVMDRQAELRRARPPRVAASLISMAHCTVADWRALYASIGAIWHWHDRDAWSEEKLAEYLANSSVSVYRVEVQHDGECIPRAGFLELELAPSGAAEIVYLGLHSRVFGVGLGAWLLGEAVDHAFALGASRVWLHTCTLDSPAALPNYLARGFRVDRVETYLTRLPG